MSDKLNAVKRFRSPPYPYLGLPKAIEKAGLLFQKAQHHPVGLNVLASAWGMSAQSGSLLKSAAALIQFGLIKDHGSGDARKFQLTEAARRIIQDADPNSQRRQVLIKAAAVSPSIHKELWEKFGNPGQLSDALLKNHLLFDRTEIGEAPFSDTSADEVIQTYREAISFAKLDDKSSDLETASSLSNSSEPLQNSSERNGAMSVSVGDCIQWESNGVLQFQQPKRVRWISDDGAWVAVDGSDTGIPATEIILEEKDRNPPAIPREGALPGWKSPPPATQNASQEWIRTAVGPQTFVSIYVDGAMGPREIGKLIKLLEVQQLILQED